MIKEITTKSPVQVKFGIFIHKYLQASLLWRNTYHLYCLTDNHRPITFISTFTYIYIPVEICTIFHTLTSHESFFPSLYPAQKNSGLMFLMWPASRNHFWQSLFLIIGTATSFSCVGTGPPVMGTRTVSYADSITQSLLSAIPIWTPLIFLI